MQIEGLKHTQEKVMVLTILEPTMYDVPIPHVYDQLCKTPAKPMRANSRRYKFRRDKAICTEF